MSSTETLLQIAAQRATEALVNYAGEVLPAEALALLQALPGAVLVDVRTQAERDFVGFIPGSLHLEWQGYPGGVRNPDFLQQLQAEVRTDQPVLFLCRSGARSQAASSLAAQSGYTRAYNVLQGFEGDRDANGQRNRVGGWRVAGLPWKQS